MKQRIKVRDLETVERQMTTVSEGARRVGDSGAIQSKDERAGVVIEDVTKAFGPGNVALQDVNLTIDAGEFVSILGPSGCGKSTLMLLVAGLVGATEGRVSIAGSEVVKPITDVGIVFQDDLLLEFRSALDNVALQCEIRGSSTAEARKMAREVLATMGLEGACDRYPRQMSGGMRQRASIARALIHEPSILLMDEPFGALDAITRTRMQVELEKLWLSGQRKTVLFITHSIEEAVRMSDRVIVLSPSPGQVAGEFVIDVPRPRPIVIEDSAELTDYSRRIYQLFYQLGVFDG